MLVCTGFTASPGSFCLFWEKIASLLPTVTSVDPPGVTGAAAAAIWDITDANTNAAARASRLLSMPPSRLPPTPPNAGAWWTTG